MLFALLVQLIYISESTKQATVRDIVALLDEFSSYSLKTEISFVFLMHNDDYHIKLPRENWRVNDYSQAVVSLVMFASKTTTGCLSRWDPSLKK